MSIHDTKKMDPQKMVAGLFALLVGWTVVSGHWLVPLLVVMGLFVAGVVLFAWTVRPASARGEPLRLRQREPLAAAVRRSVVRLRNPGEIRLVDGTGIEPVAPAV